MPPPRGQSRNQETEPMWAVGRLSLLSRGLEAAKPDQAAPQAPMPLVSVAAVPKEPAAVPIPIPIPIPEPLPIPKAIPAPVRMPTHDTVPIAPPPPQPARLETVPFPAEAQSVAKAHPVVKPEPPIAPMIVPAPVPVEVAPAAPAETPSLLRRIVTRVTRFFRSLFS